MKTIVLLFSTLICNLCFAANPAGQPMPAAQAAVYLSFAGYPDPNCVLTNDLNPGQPARPVTFTLHTSGKDSSVTFNATDALRFFTDPTTGSESLTGPGLLLTEANGNITKISINGLTGSPQIP